MRRLGAALVASAMLVAGCSGGTERVIVAAGTTVVDSGLLDRVAARFEETHPGIRISIVGQPTRLALELGRDGAVDLTITHAPEQEADYAADGHAAALETVFRSHFVLVGPAELRSKFRGRELADVMGEIHATGLTFVSRGDGSGTYDKEVENWQEAGLDPRGQPWYLVTGLGMGPTLLVADQVKGVTLSEYGAFLTARGTVSLVNLEVDPGGLDNPYTGMVSASSAQPEAAMTFLKWLVSAEGRAAILAANEELFGETVYQP